MIDRTDTGRAPGKYYVYLMGFSRFWNEGKDAAKEALLNSLFAFQDKAEIVTKLLAVFDWLAADQITACIAFKNAKEDGISFYLEFANEQDAILAKLTYL